MNNVNTVATLPKGEKEKLTKGNNRHSREMVSIQSSFQKITENSQLGEALRWSMNGYQADPKTLTDMRPQIENIIAAIPFLPYTMPVLKDIKPYHVEDLLNKTREINNARKTDALGRPRTKQMSDNTWNRYKTHLGMLMSVLVNDRILVYNPAHNVKIKSIAKKKHTPIQPEDIEKIDKHLSKNHPGLWAFVHIFCHSQVREIELANVKVKDVNLVKQVFKVINKTGGGNTEEFYHAIDKEVLPIWQNHIRNANPGHYVFSQDFLPGNKFRCRQDPPPHIMRADYITKQWEKKVKLPLGINHTLHELKPSGRDCCS